MVTIRRAKISDEDGIRDVARQSWQATYANIISAENQDRLLQNYYSPSALKEAIQRERSWFFVAIEKAVVGYAQFVVRADGRGQLTRIYVLPEIQRQGLGAKLMKEGMKELKELGVEQVMVEVEKENQIGTAFYKKNKFTFERELAFELPGETLVLCEYVLSLSPVNGAG